MYYLLYLCSQKILYLYENFIQVELYTVDSILLKHNMFLGCPQTSAHTCCREYSVDFHHFKNCNSSALF